MVHNYETTLNLPEIVDSMSLSLDIQKNPVQMIVCSQAPCESERDTKQTASDWKAIWIDSSISE